ncbi:GNAT family N-acetyltransferase [Providencia sp. wls1943]|uniref:GNAT family N-acetyltransferase n=1 Tax=unclassified Providencia TaxID=2633465 RepID=UPI0012B561E6|nr:MULTISPECIES: GNAT family N-acetyltransferase [unclassified Providencia]MTB67578.1 GNAT family N-acetyltransferase [Providencia sp. wls1943]
MLIRLATLQDIAALLNIDTYIMVDSIRRQQIQDWVMSQSCYLAEEKGEVLGYGVLNYHFFGCGFIEMLMVAERFRHRGIGLALLKALQEICHHPKLFTSTNQSNLLMQKLLLKSGFIPSGQIDNLDDNDPEIIFYHK